MATGVATFVPNKHLALTNPELTVAGRLPKASTEPQCRREVIGPLRGTGFEGADAVFADNYFDLPAGRSVTITCTRPEGWSLEMARRTGAGAVVV